ncbi:MAG TPA: fumarylacetoacetate hydrolase family protein [Candidatus Binataceae bacterium]|jgi:2-oxo-3-hexenedioate decarboxylase/2-keto-4-pentenoate hydratase|nr:fumarylacetoacetate hydrolase family protein [Candidatus Binataceae bacterium]
MISPPDVQASVEVLVAARARRLLLERLPPSGASLSVDDAYAIQEAFARRCGLPVVGYKIGCASKESQALVKAQGPFTALIFAPGRLDSPAEVPSQDFFTLGVEAEFAFTMRSGLPARAAPYERAEVAAAVAALWPAIEICDTRIARWKAARIEEIIADNGFHGGLVVGRGIADWRRLDLAAHEVAISVNGAVRAKGASAATLGDPFDGLAWIANDLARRGRALRPGDIVATGTWTGLHFVSGSAEVVADFGSLGRVALSVR